jgi:DNA polymerase
LKVRSKEPQEIPQLQYFSQNSVTKKWEETRSYGGKIVENITQAVARDLLADAMLRVEKCGYPIVATIHDEILAERAVGEGSLKDFERLMKIVPDWAPGCPIDVEGFEATRYRK